jgi:hypothetical protein
MTRASTRSRNTSSRAPPPPTPGPYMRGPGRPTSAPSARTQSAAARPRRQHQAAGPGPARLARPPAAAASRPSAALPRRHCEPSPGGRSHANRDGRNTRSAPRWHPGTSSPSARTGTPAHTTVRSPRLVRKSRTSPEQTCRSTLQGPRKSTIVIKVGSTLQLEQVLVLRRLPRAVSFSHRQFRASLVARRIRSGSNPA